MAKNGSGRREEGTASVEAKRNGHREKRLNGFAFLFPVTLCYYEILFCLFTVGGLFKTGTVVTLLFCFVYGGIGYLLCTLGRNRRRNRHIALALLLLSALPFLIELFVYEAFKIFYDLNTVINGAGGVLTGFIKDVFRLLFSPRGILCILLYFLPGILYGVFGKLLDASPIGGRARGMALARMAAFYLLCLMVIHLIPGLSRVYGEAYNFHNAVSQFGLLTGLRLDIKQNLFGEASFTDMTPVDVPASPPEQTGDPEAGGTASPETEGQTDAQTEGQTGGQTGQTADAGAIQPASAAFGYNQLDLPLDDPNGRASGTIRNLNAYVAGLTPSMKSGYTGLFKGKNLIFITAEAFSKEVIDPELTPALYRLASKGVQFTDYYQPSGFGTTGGEYQNIFGLLPTDGGPSFKEMSEQFVKLNIGTKLNELGYYGKAFHNNTYTYYDRDETHTTLGYSDGYMAEGNGMEQYVTHQWPQSDYEMFVGTVNQYLDRQPFDIYYMTVSGHGIYTIESNAMSRKHIDRTADLPYSDEVKRYIAANLDLEDAMAYLLEQLEAKGIADETVICLSADHFPYGLDENGYLGNMPYLSELYGYDVETSFQRDHSCWLLWSGSLEDQAPIVVDEPTCSLDILPTLLNLFGVDFDSRLLPGRDVFSDAPALAFDAAYNWKSEYGTYYNAEEKFEPCVDESLIPDNYVTNMCKAVMNKINFCRGVLDSDYYTYLFWG